MYEAVGAKFKVLLDENNNCANPADVLCKDLKKTESLIILSKISSVPEAFTLAQTHPEAQWLIRQFDSSGTPEPVCGNSVCVSADFLRTKNIIAPARRDTVMLASLNCVFDVLTGVGGYGVDLQKWQPGHQEPQKSADFLQNLGLSATAAKITMIDLQVEHRVVLVSPQIDLDHLDMRMFDELSPLQRFSRTVYAQFIKNSPVVDAVGQIRFRVYKHGTGEIASCSSSAAAAALVARADSVEFTRVHTWRAASPAGDISIRMFPTENGEHVAARLPVARESPVYQ